MAGAGGADGVGAGEFDVEGGALGEVVVNAEGVGLAGAGEGLDDGGVDPGGDGLEALEVMVVVLVGEVRLGVGPSVRLVGWCPG